MRGRFLRGFCLLSLSVLVLWGCGKTSFDFPEPEVESYGMRPWLEYLCSEECEGRVSGTQGNRKAYDYLVGQLESMGYQPVTQEFEVDGKTLRNIYVRIPSEVDTSIVIGAHFDGNSQSNSHHHYPAANDNASGTVAVLKLADDLKKNVFKSKYTITLCLFDGEENTLTGPLKGSTYFVNNYDDLKAIKYYHNLDVVGHKHEIGLDIYYYGDIMEDDVVPFVLQNSDLKFTEVKAREKGKGSSDYVPFSKVGLPIINVKSDETGCIYRNHSVYDDPAVISFSTMMSIIRIVEDVVCHFN